MQATQSLVQEVGEKLDDIVLAHVVAMYVKYHGDVHEIARALGRSEVVVRRKIAQARARGWLPKATA